MKAYIQKYRTISRLDSFENGILASKKNAELLDTIHPDYKEIIPVQLIRRMTKAIRMGVGAALKTKADYAIEGIIVGTGLGCLENSEKFLNQFVTRKEGILSPTSFIQSTHNTVAGQIGIILKDNCYNSTYTQRGQSFENALIDGMLLTMETKGNVLVGGLDETIPLMEELGKQVDVGLDNLGESSTFFIISQDKESAKAELVACKTLACSSMDLKSEVKTFLEAEQLAMPDVILYGNSFPNGKNVPTIIEGIELSNYSFLSGEYMTNSAFGIQMASELIEDKEEDYSALVVNNFNNKDFGFTYLRKP